MNNVRQQLQADRAKIRRIYAAHAQQLNTEFQQATTRSEYGRIKSAAEQIVRGCTFIDINGALLALIDQAAEQMKADDD